MSTQIVDAEVSFGFVQDHMAENVVEREVAAGGPTDVVVDN